MKKVIAAFDGLHFSEATLDYTLYIAKQNTANIVGVFLDDMAYHSYGYKELMANETISTDIFLHQLKDQDQDKRDEAVQFFEDMCNKAGVNYSVHRDRNIALLELINESIYADLLIMSKTEIFAHVEEACPSRFLKDVLSEVACPVLVVPETFVPLQNLVILYDGEPASVYAIKMLSYLLPACKQLPAQVITVKEKETSLHVPNKRLMKEFMQRHFPDAQYHVCKGIPEEEIRTKLQGSAHSTLVVLGAYQRGRVARWFKPGMADYLMQHVDTPLFIAHNKN